MLESTYQARLIKQIHKLLPGCIVLKNDPNYMQGFPDLTILYRARWGVLEVKPDASAEFQPNQEYYIDTLNGMSFGAVIYPEIEEDVLHDLQRSLGARRPARVSQR